MSGQGSPPRTAIYLSEQEIEQLIDMPLAIQVMDEAFRALAAGKAENVPRVRAKAPGIVLHSMSATASYLGLVGWKQYTTTRQGTHFLVGLHDQQQGQLLALLEANRLGQIRTGAVSGLAIKLLAAPDADRVGILGSGWQAESQLLAAAAARKLKRAIVYSRDVTRRTAFAERMSRELQIEVLPAAEAREAVEGLPLVVTATSSRQPVLDGSWLAPDVLVCAIGSNYLEKAELDIETIRRGERIVCDSIACCRQEAGDFVPALQADAFDWQLCVELAHVAAGQLPGRTRTPQRILFKSVGMALEDVALGGKLLAQARAQGLGRPLPA